MNKTVSINLSGLLFNLEEAAYEKLKAYLNKIRGYFLESDGRDEIIGDIEGRIAELFQERVKDKQVVLEADVAEVIGIMGQPEVYAPEQEDSANQEPGRKQQYREENYAGTRRLFRSTDEAKLGGVCAGLGYYFGIDPVWIRIGFLIALFFFGSGPLIYIILWIALPEATTTAEKLKMKGEPVTVENIQKQIREEMGRFKETASSFTSKATSKFQSGRYVSRAGDFFNDVLDIIIKLIKKIVQVMGKSLGVIFILGGLLFFFVWLSIVLGSDNLIGFSDNDGEVFTSFSLHAFFESFFSTPGQVRIFMIGLALVTLAPIIAFILAGTKLLVYPRFKLGWPGAINGSMFILGLIFLIISGAMMMTDFKASGRLIQPMAASVAPSDTIKIVMKGEDVNFKRKVNFDNWQFFFHDDEQFITGRIKLRVEKAENDKLSFNLEKSARGKDKKEAILTASMINSYSRQNGSEFQFNPYFTLREGSKWRSQSIIYTMKLPEGAFIRFENGSEDALDDIHNVQNINDYDMTDKLWKMGKDGLECLSCEVTRPDTL